MNGSRTKPIKVLMLGAGLEVKGGITSVEKLILQYAPQGLTIEHLETFAPGSALYNIKVFLRAALQLTQRLLFDKQISAIHIHFSERGSTIRKMILFLIAINFRKPIVLHAHGATYQEFFRGLPTIVQRFIAGLFQKCTTLIALSESWKAFYAQAFHLPREKIAVLYNPVHLPPSVPMRAEREVVTFVFLGRIGQRGGALDLTQSVVSFPRQDKGAFDLIRAFAALPEPERAKARLVLAGNGDTDLAQTLVEELGLKDQVTIHTWLDAAERDLLLQDADAFVLPSYHEGLPMSMLEAMAWGLPVIVTPVGGIPEVITHEHNGLVVQPGHQAEITQAMHRFIVSSKLRSLLGRNARNDVQMLSIDHYMARLLDLYGSVIDGDQPIAVMREPLSPSVR